MFGYVTINASALSEEARARYRACYCGLCAALKKKHGSIGRMTLSYDMTFLYILLSSLYEPEEREEEARCVAQPLRPHAFAHNEFADYAADMNIALCYHKAQDDWQDDRSVMALAQRGLLARAYGRVEAEYPRQCDTISSCLAEISALEAENAQQVDGPANWTGRMLGEIFVLREDLWAAPMRAMGEALGRFIYIMDAYEDLPEDVRRGRYNPLASLSGTPDYEALCQDVLLSLMGECAQAFEALPLVRDVEVLRNILYGGVWVRYGALQQKRAAGEVPVA